LFGLFLLDGYSMASITIPYLSFFMFWLGFASKAKPSAEKLSKVKWSEAKQRRGEAEGKHEAAFPFCILVCQFSVCTKHVLLSVFCSQLCVAGTCM
jgi:hypothetical protein